MNRRLILALAPAPLALALATTAFAQPATAPQPMMRRGEPTADMRARHEAMLKQHAEDLKIVLRLRPDQEAALNALIAAHGPQDWGDMHGMMGGPSGSTAQTTPQRLDEMAKRDAARAARREKMRDAVARFYAALSPDQQKVFDALQRLQGGPGGMHGDRDGGPHMMMRQGPGGPGGPPPGDGPK